MKRSKGILGASLAGFAALTMAAITTSTTEAIAFKKVNRGLKAPTMMSSVSRMQRLVCGKKVISQDTHATARLPRPPRNSVLPVEDMSAQRVGKRFETPSDWRVEWDGWGHYRVWQGQYSHWRADPINRIVKESTANMPTFIVTPTGKTHSTAEDRAKSDKYLESYIDPGLDHLTRMFNKPLEELNIAKPEGLPDGGPAEHGQDCTWWWDLDTKGFLNYESAVDQLGHTHADAQFGVCPDDMDFTDGSGGTDNDDVDMDFTVDYDFVDDSKGGGKDAGPKDTGSEDTDTNDTVEEQPQDDDSGGSSQPDTDPDEAGSDDPEGDGGPDEMRNAFRNELFDTSSFEAAAMDGGGSDGSSNSNPFDGGSGTYTPSGIEIIRDAIPGIASPIRGDRPDVIDSPAGAAVTGINLMTGYAMSPTLDDRQSGTGPGGPIGPVATTSESFSVDMDLSLSAAMSDPMGSPTVDDRESGTGPGGPIGPVADRIR